MAHCTYCGLDWPPIFFCIPDWQHALINAQTFLWSHRNLRIRCASLSSSNSLLKRNLKLTTICTYVSYRHCWHAAYISQRDYFTYFVPVSFLVNGSECPNVPSRNMRQSFSIAYFKYERLWRRLLRYASLWSLVSHRLLNVRTISETLDAYRPFTSRHES